MTKIVITILLLLNFYKCEKMIHDRYRIYVENKTNNSIGAYFAVGGNFGTKYPDTTLPINNNYLIKEIKSGNKFPYDSGVKWEEIFKKLPQDTLSIFIFDADTLEYYDWGIIRDEYKVLQRYDLSLEDLRKRNFVLEYPYDSSRGVLKVWKP